MLTKIPGLTMRGDRKEIGAFIENRPEIKEIISESGFTHTKYNYFSSIRSRKQYK